MGSDSKKDVAKRIFKQLKAGIRKWEDLSEDELYLVFKYYSSLFPCEFKEDETICGFPSAFLIVAEDNDGKKQYFTTCKKHNIKLTIRLLYKGYKVMWLRR